MAALPQQQGRYGGYMGYSLMTVPNPNAEIFPEICDYLMPYRRVKSVTFALTMLDIVMFAITLIVGRLDYDGAVVQHNDMLGPSAETLRAMGGKFTPDIKDDYELYRLVTPIVLHAGFIHIIFNLFFQLRFGFIFEMRWGRLNAFVLYLLTGISGVLWSTHFSKDSVSVGASGALFGWLGADVTYVVLNWGVLRDCNCEMIMLCFIIGINLLMGMGSNIDNYAHLGGLVMGLVLAPLFTGPLLQPNAQKLRYARIASVVIGIGLFALFVALIWA